MKICVYCMCGNVVTKHVNEGQYPPCIKCKECEVTTHLRTSQVTLSRGGCLPTKSEDKRSKLVSENREQRRHFPDSYKFRD